MVNNYIEIKTDRNIGMTTLLLSKANNDPRGIYVAPNPLLAQHGNNVAQENKWYYLHNSIYTVREIVDREGCIRRDLDQPLNLYIDEGTDLNQRVALLNLALTYPNVIRIQKLIIGDYTHYKPKKEVFPDPSKEYIII